MNDRIEIKAALAVSDAGEITGTAWPFGSPDRVGDVVVPGAITTPASLPMLFGHDQGQVVGVWNEIAETTEGLIVKGRLLVDDVERAREVRAMVKAGAVSGLSIGFTTKASTPRQGGGRVISALDLHEISVVAVPAHPGARIISIKENPTIEQENLTMEIEDKTNVQPDQKALDAVQARLDALEAKAQRPGAVVAPAVSAEQKAFGNYLRRGRDHLDDMDRKALTVSANANGGFLVPSEYASELLKLLREKSPIRQYARVMQVEASEIIFPRKVSGTTAVWTDEGDDMTESGMTFEQVKIANHELSTFVTVSNKLIEDNAYNLEGELLADFSEDFAAKEAVAFLKGTGTGQPKGILTATGITEVKTGVAASFPTTDPADVLIGMFHAIPTLHAHNAVWMMNRATLGEVRKWKDNTGRYLVIDPQDGAPSQLLGRPVVEVPDMDSIGAGKTPILFGDLAGYRIVDRVGLSVLHDPFTLGLKSQVRFIARRRVGGDVTNPDRFVKLKVAA